MNTVASSSREVYFASYWIFSFCGRGLRQAEFGNWVVRLPADSDHSYAVGGPNPDRTAANDNARAEMVKFISVTVDSEIEQVTAEQYGEYHWKLGTVLRSQIIG